MIYFDNAATTYPKPESVYEGVSQAMHRYGFNAGRGEYKQSLETYNMIEKTREKIAKFVSTEKNKVVFTASATEAINIIIDGSLEKDDVVFVSPFEHNAVIRTLVNKKIHVEIIPFNINTWRIDEEKLHNLIILKKPKAVILSHISNVTGFMLPYQQVFEISKKYNCINILDAAQSYGIYDMTTNNVDYVVFDGHKSLYALFGIGGFIQISSHELKVTRAGGTGSDSLNTNMPTEMPMKYEAGTMNSISIYSLSCGIDFLNNKDVKEKIEDLTQYFLKEVAKLKNIVLYAQNNNVHGIVSFNLEGYSCNEISEILSNEFEICVRSGFHCAPYIHDFINSKKFNGTVRVSFSYFNTTEEIDKLIEVLRQL